jgi:hypothetical protein
MQVIADLEDLVDGKGISPNRDRAGAREQEVRSQQMRGLGIPPGQAVLELANRIRRTTRTERDEVGSQQRLGKARLVRAEPRAAPTHRELQDLRAGNLGLPADGFRPSRRHVFAVGLESGGRLQHRDDTVGPPRGKPMQRGPSDVGDLPRADEHDRPGGDHAALNIL